MTHYQIYGNFENVFSLEKSYSFVLSRVHTSITSSSNALNQVAQNFMRRLNTV